MATTAFPVLHCSATREDHGGVQSVLAFHHAREAEAGFAPRFVSCFDRTVTWSGDCTSLAGHGWETVGALRRRFARAMADRPAVAAIYHDGWGIDWFAPLDRASRRVVLAHTERPYFDALVRHQAACVDGFLTVSRALAERIRRAVPAFPAGRIQALPLFVDPPAWFATRVPEPARAGPVRLGYAGRIQKGQKRLDRLPALVAELDRRGLDYVFEVLGDGDYEPELRRQLPNHPRVKFLGWRQGEDYWQVIAGWHAMVLLSDFEGFSRAAMEAMSGGVIPVYPDFSPAAAELLGPAASHALYPVGDMAAAAAQIVRLATAEPVRQAALVADCRRHLAAHSPANYLACYADFVRTLADRPPLARAVAPPAWHNAVPLGVYTRLFPHRF